MVSFQEMSMSTDQPAVLPPIRGRKRHPRIIAEISRNCRAGRHIVAADVRTDDQGVEHGRCRHCGCELARMPVLRRWFRTGEMG
ncbi:hypothetical protein HY78_00720 [Rhizorhabdus wittichii DC-6]|nr:hypothetical protein HY78_00720 [Rhizorhabdus wittichii DC-6]